MSSRAVKTVKSGPSGPTMHAAASAAPGLDLFEDAVDHESAAEILDLVDAHIAQGRAGTLACKSYVAPPADWRRTGQGRETMLFGVHVKCNKVQNAAVLPLPPLLEALLDRLEARGIFAASERPDTCCVNAYEAGSWLPPHVDSAAFDRPFFTLSLLSVQEVVFGEAIGGADGECGRGQCASRCRSARCCALAARPPMLGCTLCRVRRRGVSLTFRRLSEPTRARFAALQEAADAAELRGRERRLEAKLARGWRPRPTGDAEVEPQPMVVCEAPAGRRRCCQCGILFDACGVELTSAGVACSVACVKARARQRSAHGWSPNLSYPNLEFGRYRAQRLFHPIDLAHPGLQLVHEEPYIFVCHNFLSADECALLIAKAKTASLDQQLVGESSASHRTSTGCVLHRDESQQLRRRIAALANVGEAQLQPLKVSRYERGSASPSIATLSTATARSMSRSIITPTARGARAGRAPARTRGRIASSPSRVPQRRQGGRADAVAVDQVGARILRGAGPVGDVVHDARGRGARGGDPAGGGHGGRPLPGDDGGERRRHRPQRVARVGGGARHEVGRAKLRVVAPGAGRRPRRHRRARAAAE